MSGSSRTTASSRLGGPPPGGVLLGPLTAAVTLAAYADYSSVAVWQLTGPQPELTSGTDLALAATNASLYEMPAYSVSVLVPQ
ncbi:hypothetical protein OV203_12585 [Nannocystis sp. ILAH1]|uniref:hypothetical protein n=1 Tax=unclassified Nannocystis TaxID=2627009 RepID=UPI00226FA072|nr:MULTISPECIES: hypothetical protein [unclassified Nannocystis]MCY0987967.1 hypothetical protein [Nannocystis sp. ILAH1]MCY1065690.1 hypothetical protein [Nannocystis sp. RBIL2]